jgi:hypothetical protein
MKERQDTIKERAMETMNAFILSETMQLGVRMHSMYLIIDLKKNERRSALGQSLLKVRRQHHVQVVSRR